jgi:hypothetical protein
MGVFMINHLWYWSLDILSVLAQTKNLKNIIKLNLQGISIDLCIFTLATVFWGTNMNQNI